MVRGNQTLCPDRFNVNHMDLNMADLNRISIPYCGFFELHSDHDRACVARVIGLIGERDDAFTRNPEHGHITASALVVSRDCKALLMTHHAKLDRWLQLGGHCDGLKDPYFVAKKEAYEESGLHQIHSLAADIVDIDIHAIPASAREPEHWHYDLRYVFQADQSAALQLSHESRQLRWVALDGLESVTDAPSVLRLRSAIARFSQQYGL